MAPPPDNKFSSASEAARIYILPSLFTAGNLFFGFVAIVRCIQAKNGESDPSVPDAEVTRFYVDAVWSIFLAFVCDALDGRVARLGGRESLFGKEFDSIADVVSFGVAPALMVFFLILSPTEGFPFFRQVGWLIGFIYLLCAGVRLARFNVITHPLLPDKDESADDQFLGLPVPVAAGFIASLVLVLVRHDLQHFTLLLPPLMLLIAWLMVSGVQYPSFKHIDWHTHTNAKAFIALFIALVAAFILFQRYAFALVFLVYIFYGPVTTILRWKRQKKTVDNNP